MSESKNRHLYIIYEISCDCCNNKLYGFKLIKWSLEIEFNEILQDYDYLTRLRGRDGLTKKYNKNEFIDHMKKNEFMGFKIKLNNVFYPENKDSIYGKVYKEAIDYLKMQEKYDPFNKSKLHYFKQKTSNYIDIDSIVF